MSVFILGAFQASSNQKLGFCFSCSLANFLICLAMSSN